MTDILLIALLVIAVGSLVLQLLALFRGPAVDLSPIQQSFKAIEDSHQRGERAVREEIGMNRQEISAGLGQSRDELNNSVKRFAGLLFQQLAALIRANDQKIDQMREAVDQRLRQIQQENARCLDAVRQDAQATSRTLRDEVSAAQRASGDSLVSTVGEMGRLQKAQLDGFAAGLTALTASTEQRLDAHRVTIDGRLSGIAEDGANSARQLREEVGNTMRGMSEDQRAQIQVFAAQLGKLIESNEQKLDALKCAVEEKLKGIQQDNARQLDQMRETVDEKLQGTLERRLGESFKQVSDRLEAVHKGLGEMSTLAVGVGDLKKVLTNVKSRGTWGEVLLGSLLQEVLSPDQYAANVATKEEQERVEYAIKLPGRGDSSDEVVWLPIDAKFPKEDYERLIEAQERADPEGAEAAGRGLEKSVRGFAATICRKYLNPPKTTDFGIMFLPTEGLYAEVVRRVGLVELIQRESRVVIAGPTTVAALLNSLQMGFKTLAIQKRSSEVWKVLGDVKTQFSLYGGVIDKLKKKLDLASKTVDQVGVRTRAIHRKLSDVQALPGVDAGPLPPPPLLAEGVEEVLVVDSAEEVA
jgi:DNA recombination protein RmuC